MNNNLQCLNCNISLNKDIKDINDIKDEKEFNFEYISGLGYVDLNKDTIYEDLISFRKMKVRQVDKNKKQKIRTNQINNSKKVNFPKSRISK